MATRESQLQPLTEISPDDYVRIATAGGSSRKALLSLVVEKGLNIDSSVLTLYQSLGWTEPE